MSVRARMFVQTVARNAGETSSVSLQAVSRGKENSEWSKYTPGGNLTLTLSREASAAFAYFDARVGKEVFIDISDADDPICTQCGEPVEKTPADRENWGGSISAPEGGYLPDEFVHVRCLAAAKERLGLA